MFQITIVAVVLGKRKAEAVWTKMVKVVSGRDVG
jgi:hypothetical protein